MQNAGKCDTILMRLRSMQSPAEGAAQPASQRAAALALVTFRVLLAGTGICTSRAQDIPQGASKHSSPRTPCHLIVWVGWGCSGVS